MHDREKLYRFLWDHSDSNNVVAMKQGEVAKEFGISYQQLSVAVKEFIEMNMIDKSGHRFVVLYDPDRIPWDRFTTLRKSYIRSKTGT